MTLESIAPMSDNTTVELPDMAAYRPAGYRKGRL